MGLRSRLHPPDQSMDDPEHPDERARREGQGESADDQRNEPVGQGRGAGAGDRSGEQPADPRRTGGVPRILPGRGRGQPEPCDHDEGIGNQEHEEAERHRRGQHASPALGVPFDGLERGVDRRRVSPPGFDSRPGALRPLAQMLHPIPDGLMGRVRVGMPLSSAASGRSGRPPGRQLRPWRILHPTASGGRATRRIPPCGRVGRRILGLGATVALTLVVARGHASQRPPPIAHRASARRRLLLPLESGELCRRDAPGAPGPAAAARRLVW